MKKLLKRLGLFAFVALAVLVGTLLSQRMLTRQAVPNEALSSYHEGYVRSCYCVEEASAIKDIIMTTIADVAWWEFQPG